MHRFGGQVNNQEQTEGKREENGSTVYGSYSLRLQALSGSPMEYVLIYLGHICISVSHLTLGFRVCLCVYLSKVWKHNIYLMFLKEVSSTHQGCIYLKK